MRQRKPLERADARPGPNLVVGRGRPTILRSALPLLSCRSALGRGQISVDPRFLLGVNRLEGACDLIVGVFIEQLLESLGIELAAGHAKIARPFLRSLKEWGRNRDGCLHSQSRTQLYRLGRWFTNPICASRGLLRSRPDSVRTALVIQSEHVRQRGPCARHLPLNLRPMSSYRECVSWPPSTPPRPKRKYQRDSGRQRNEHQLRG